MKTVYLNAVQAHLVALVSNETLEDETASYPQLQIGFFKGVPTAPYELTLGILALTFLVALPIPALRMVPRLPREFLFGAVSSCFCLALFSTIGDVSEPAPTV